MLPIKVGFSVLLCLSLAVTSLASEFVPLLLWTNTKYTSCQNGGSFRPGETFSSVFSKNYLECLQQTHPSNVFIFAYDRLSIEDFTLFGSSKEQAFHNIHKYVEKYNTSLVVPSIEPANIIDDLTDAFHQTFSESNIQIDTFHSIDRSTPSATAKGLMELDAKIKQTLDAVDGSYIAIVTSENVVDQDSLQTGHGMGRHLLAVEEIINGTTYLIGNCTYMAYKTLTLFVGTEKSSLVASSKATFVAETCAPKNSTNGTNIAEMTYTPTNSSSITGNVTVRFEFVTAFYPVSAMQWWNLADVTVTYTSGGTTKTQRLNRRSFNSTITAPIDWSFVCQAPENISFIGNTSATQVSLQFNHVQMQSFGVANNTFSRALDCEGWFTGPIWMGLLVGLLVIVMLFYGLAMLSQVTTMDRFDDPKGKTITVPQVD
uniref:Uncharacterized protein LOC101242403 n=1 Tax=Phallusia mammillata TaxID=59560 RepID=A0A6F9DI00_9ASCI|nr:uncharacterized protein LOC101242403 [Phallusia mammillata]